MRSIYGNATYKANTNSGLMQRISGTFLGIFVLCFLVAAFGSAVAVSVLPKTLFMVVVARVFVVLGGFAFCGAILHLWVTAIAVKPLRQIVSWADVTKTLSPIAIPENASKEVREAFSVMNSMIDRLILAQKELVDLEKNSAIGQVASQVAHDIRSPLAALDAITKDIAQLPEDKRIIVRSAIGRIRDIANSLIEKNRQLSGDRENYSMEENKLGSVQLLSSLIDPVVTEKRLQFRSRIGVEIDSHLDAASYGLFAQIQPLEFKRVLSNLVNNGVEALEKNGSVFVTMSSANDKIEIKVADTGRGISPEVLNKLGQRGETHGKAGGSGLGLYHAKTSVEAWGGTLRIESAPAKGTTVTIMLPMAQAPAWFVPELNLVPGSKIVVLDDDTSIHQVWQGRFDSVRVGDSGVQILHFSAPDEFRSWVKNNNDAVQSTTYLTDYELIGYKETGLSLVEELGIGEWAILVTSRYEEKQILEDCRRLKVRMIPKGLAGLVPIKIKTDEGQKAERSRGAVLLDDDPLVCMNWKMAAKSKDINLEIFKNAADFMARVESLPQDAAIYIDSELGDGIKGEDIAEKLHKRGFTEIALETGHEAARFVHFPWLKVLGKEPPWA